MTAETVLHELSRGLKKKATTMGRLYSHWWPEGFLFGYRVFSDASRLVVRKDTELVIEGFPRSGNTFAVVSFYQAQSRAVRIAHHIHSSAQVLWGIRNGVPVIVLFRHPSECIRSLLVRHPDVSLRYALRSYLNFYRPIVSHSDSLVFADFSEAVGDFSRVVRRANAKFGTFFDVPSSATSARRRVEEEVVRINLRDSSGSSDAIALPTYDREEKKSRIVIDENAIEYQKCVEIFTIVSKLHERDGLEA